MVVVSTPAQTLTFSFLALEPVDFTGMAEAKLVTPATATGADVLTVAPGFDSLNGLLAALVVSGTVGGTAIESGYFFGNQSVVIATGSGSDGTDSVTIVGACESLTATRTCTIDTGPLGADAVAGRAAMSRWPASCTWLRPLLNVQETISLGGSASIATRGDTNFNASGQLSSPQVAMTAGGAILAGRWVADRRRSGNDRAPGQRQHHAGPAADDQQHGGGHRGNEPDRKHPGRGRQRRSEHCGRRAWVRWSR